MTTFWAKKTMYWLLASAVIPTVLVGCQDPTPTQATFNVTGKSLGSSFVDGTSIQPLEATVKNISDIAGTPPNVSFNTTSDLEFQSIDSTLYKCEATSEIVVLCSAIDGAKLEGAASTSLKPVFDVVAKNTANFDPTSTGTSSTRATTRNHLLNVGIGINSAVLQAPILFEKIALTAAATGFDLSIAKTVSQPFIAGATGEFTLTATVATLPIPTMPPFYVKVQDPALPAGFTYNYTLTNTNNPAWTCVSTVGGGISCKLKPSWVAANPGVQPPPIKVTVNVASSVTTTTQFNCPWVYPALGDTNLNNNHLGPFPYTMPCTPYTPIKIDLGITKTQTAPLTAPANSFYWGLPGQYTINVHNYSTVATSTPIVVTDVLTNQPTGGGLALGPTFTVNAPWTCIPLNFNSGPITCTFTGSIPAGGNAPPLVFNFTVKPENAALAIAETNCATLPNDANNQNNSSCIQSQNMALEGFDLQITKTHVAGPILNPAPGTPINYILNVQNNGTGDAPGSITVTDNLPAVFTSVNPTITVTSTGVPALSPLPTCTWTPAVSPPPFTLTCVTSTSMPAGSSFSVSFKATTDLQAGGQTVKNKATVSNGAYDVGDSNLQNNTSSDTVILASGLNLHRAESVVQAANGDFIVVGSSDSATRGKQFAVRRYASDGTTVIWTKIEDLSVADDTALDIALDTLGNIVVVGRSNFTSLTACDTQAVLFKYDALGTVLAGFPQYVGTTSDSKYDYFGSVALDTTNRIITGGSDGQVASGNCGGQQESRFTLHRFTSTGTADSTFGTVGRVETDVSSLLGHTGNFAADGAFLQDVLVEQSSDQYRIYAAGSSPNLQQRAFTVARYNQNGTLDNTWGASTPSGNNGVGVIETNFTNGAVVTAQTQDSVIREIGIQNIGGVKRLIATGFNCNGSGNCSDSGNVATRRCVVTSYTTSNGVLDTAFGSGGAASFGLVGSTPSMVCNAMSVKSTGEIAITGSSYTTANGFDYLAMTLTATGGLINTYGSNNPNAYSTIPAVSPRADAGWGVVWAAAGNILTVGYSDKDATDKDEWVVKSY